MGRLTLATALAALVLAGTPAFAVSQKDKMETCKFGADEQKLTGAARKKFMANCMANRDSPRGKQYTEPKGQ